MKNAKSELFFNIILVVILTVAFVIPAFNMNHLTKIFPLVVVGLTLALILYRVLLLIPRVRGDQDQSTSSSSQWNKAVMPILWLGGLLALIFILGMILGSVFYAVFFTRFGGKCSWRATTISGAVCVLLVYGLFGIVMGFPMYQGLLSVPLPGTVGA